MTETTAAGRSPSRLYLRMARAVLGERLPLTERDAVVNTAAREYEKLAPALPPERALGARVMLRTACFDVALHRGLVGHGLDAAEARALVAEVNWRAYRRALAPSAAVMALDKDGTIAGGADRCDFRYRRAGD